MRLAWQIFRKDTERLWWAIPLTLALLIFWTFQEVTPVPFEWSKQASHASWLNMALPFLWSLLIALAIHQDPLVGDRQFWVALPCGWRPLLKAKAAFILAYIQVPYFLATAVILAARGFNPLQYLPHLFWKQLVLLAFIVPAIAVATTVKNMAQFMLLLIILASALVLFSTRLNPRGLQDTWDVRWVLIVIILCVGALAVATLQFVRRSTIRSRAIGVVMAVAAASLYSWLPREASAAIYAAFSPVQSNRAPVSLRVDSREPDYSTQQRWYNFQRTTVLIPVAFAGLPSELQPSDVRLDQISLELIRADGERYEAQWLNSSNGVRRNRIDARLENSWQALEFYSPAVWNRLSSGPVTLRGRILARLYRSGNRTTMRPDDRTFIPGLGYCSNRSSMASIAILRKVSVVECEAPSPQWPAFMLSPRYYGPAYYPQDPWLSPLWRGTISGMGTEFMAIEIASQTQFDSVIIDYTLPGLDPILFT
jgi:hypothetical protein